VVVVRDPARFEVSYVSRTDAVPALQIAVGADDGELSIERDTGAAVLRGPSGRPRLRANRPVAFDASGSRREGSYVLADARTLKVDVDVRGMTPPIVIDPAFYIPFWTLTPAPAKPCPQARSIPRTAVARVNAPACAPASHNTRMVSRFRRVRSPPPVLAVAA
jgi:hypothetical protein